MVADDPKPKKDDLTPYLSVPARIYQRLKDGQPHAKEELHGLLSNSDGADKDKTLTVHMSAIRRQLPLGHEIVVVWVKRRLYYRLVRSVCLLS